MTALTLFPARIRFVNSDGTLTNEAYRALQVVYDRIGGPLGVVGGDTLGDSITAGLQNSDLNIAYTDIIQATDWPLLADTVVQPTQGDNLADIVLQPAQADSLTEIVLQPSSINRTPVNAAAIDLPTVIALANQLRAVLIANGFVI